MSPTPPPRPRSAWANGLRLFGERPVPAPSAPAPVDDRGREFIVLDALPEPALVLEGAARAEPAGWRFTAANAAARELWRITRDEGPLVTVLRDPAVLEAVARALFDGEPAETAYELHGQHERLWQVQVRPMAQDGGPRALLRLIDQTDQRRADRTRADFLANASHELRTPLASLLGFIETLRGHARSDPAAQDRFLGIMQAQAERMNRLIDDLLSLSRIELNEHIPPNGEADLSEVVLDVLDALSPQAAARDVRLVRRLPPAGTARLTGDRDQIVQVVQNLIDNALKYSPAGGEVTVEVADEGPDASGGPVPEGWARFWILSLEHAPEQRFVRLRVADHGAGLSREQLPRLAQRFYRVEGQKSGERAGTGLGLAIVKHIVNRHHGGVLVESAPGEGTVFTIFLPRPASGSAG